MQEGCDISCTSCQPFKDPNGMLIYKCIVDNKDSSNVVIIISALAGALILVLLVIIVLIRLRRKGKLLSEITIAAKLQVINTPIETGACGKKISSEENVMIESNVKCTLSEGKRRVPFSANVRGFQSPQMLHRLIKEKQPTSKPVSEDIVDKLLVLNENKSEKECSELGSPVQNSPNKSFKKKKSLLKYNYKQLKQKENSVRFKPDNCELAVNNT
jgi:hypothetical protein